MSYDRPLSPSGLNLYEKCPFRFHAQYVLGQREESGAAALRGTQKHEALEAYFRGAPYPSADSVLSPWRDFMEGLAAKSPTAEGEVAVFADWSPASFSDPKAYFRGKKDLDHEEDGCLHIHDWKTGREYPYHVDQGKAYVAMSPARDEYKVKFVYLDQPLLVREWVYDAKDRVDIQAEFTARIEVVRNDQHWTATPGDHCDWCPLSWRRGGQCKRAP